MKRTLSFLKPVLDGLRWVHGGLLIFWRAGRFEYFPTQRNLLLSFWYGFVHYKAVKKGATVLNYLDSWVIFAKRGLENNDLASKKKQMYRDLLGALRDPRTRPSIIEFLESPNPEQHCQPIIDMIRAAWRMGEEAKPASLAGMPVPPSLPAAETGSTTSKDIVAAPEGEPVLDAKAYVIATEIYFDLANKHDDYLKISGHSGQLAEFVKREFRVSRLPTSFRRQREFSYKKIWEDKNYHKLGQLRRPFNQIIDHPEIFGKGIAVRARQILEDKIL
jgi:hypothetical protein